MPNADQKTFILHKSHGGINVDLLQQIKTEKKSKLTSKTFAFVPHYKILSDLCVR